MATWNTDYPAVGNQITADIADIEENFQELHDVITAITNGTLGTTTAGDFRVDAVTSPAILLDRARFEWKDADEIYIHAGAYHHVGTVSQVVYWNSKLTSDIGSPDASDWYYLYLDDSAIVTADTNLLTATEFVWANTEPAWSETKHGWYNGEDKCIFAVLTDGSSNILQFWHDGGDIVIYDIEVTTLSATDLNGAWTDITCTIPKFSIKPLMTYAINTAGGAAYEWRVNGSTSAGNTFSGISAGDSGQFVCMTDSSQKFEAKDQISGAGTIALYTAGWYFPTGM